MTNGCEHGAGQIEDWLRSEYGETGRELQFAGSFPQDDGTLLIRIELGFTVTESMIEADYHSEYFEPEKVIDVFVDPDERSIVSEDVRAP